MRGKGLGWGDVRWDGSVGEGEGGGRHREDELEVGKNRIKRR